MPAGNRVPKTLSQHRLSWVLEVVLLTSFIVVGAVILTVQRELWILGLAMLLGAVAPTARLIQRHKRHNAAAR